jgi:predicted nucleotidyltransferase
MNNKQKVLKFLFKEPNKEFHIRLLSRLTKLNPNTIINISKKLEKQNLIQKFKDKDRNLMIIKANNRNINYKIQKKAYNIQKIYDSGLIEYINEMLSYPTILLFGSYAKAENHPKSDIDLFVICVEKKELKLEKFTKKLESEIQIIQHTKREFNKLKKTNKELINNVINGVKLEGYVEVL